MILGPRSASTSCWRASGAGEPVILVDTSGVLAALFSDQAQHEECASALRGATPPLVLSPFVLAELDDLLAALDLALAAYDRERVHGHVLTSEGARRQLERLARLPLAERREVPALEPERAPVIVAGAAIVAAVLDRYGLDELEASERDILHGAAVEAAALPEPEEGAAPPGAYTCC